MLLNNLVDKKLSSKLASLSRLLKDFIKLKKNLINTNQKGLRALKVGIPLLLTKSFSLLPLPESKQSCAAKHLIF